MSHTLVHYKYFFLLEMSMKSSIEEVKLHVLKFLLYIVRGSLNQNLKQKLIESGCIHFLLIKLQSKVVSY